MQETLLAEGYRLVDWDCAADIRVVNTCTVTAKSDRTCRHEIRLAKRLDPDCMVVVTGCYAQIDPEAVAAIPGVDLVLGNLDKLRLAEHLAEWQPAAERRRRARRATTTAGRPRLVSPYPEHPEFEGEFFSHFYGYTRAFLKIQTGCDSRCAYCIIPLARGPARSMPKADVLARGATCWPSAASARWCSPASTWAAGAATPARGRSPTCWRRCSTGMRRRATPARDPVGRYRLSSIEPLEVDAGPHGRRRSRPATGWPTTSICRCRAAATPSFGRMNRPYTAAEYLAVVDRAGPPLPRRRHRRRRHRRLPGRDRGRVRGDPRLRRACAAHLPARLQLQRPSRAPRPPR